MLETVNCAPGHWRRRRVLRILAMSAFALPAAAGAALAEDGSKTTQGGAWLLGDNLSIAALLYNQNASKDAVDRFLSKAKKIADIFGLTIKPFPAKAATSAASSADMIHYLIAGDGAALGSALAKKYDDAHGGLFEVSVKSNLLILLYAPGEPRPLDCRRDQIAAHGYSFARKAVEQCRHARARQGHGRRGEGGGVQDAQGYRRLFHPRQRIAAFMPARA